MNVTLTKELDLFVAGQIAEGHYPSSDAIIIEGLQLLESRELKLKNLRNLLYAGKNSALLSGKEAMEKIRTTLQQQYGV